LIVIRQEIGHYVGASITLGTTLVPLTLVRSDCGDDCGESGDGNAKRSPRTLSGVLDSTLFSPKPTREALLRIDYTSPRGFSLSTTNKSLSPLIPASRSHLATTHKVVSQPLRCIRLLEPPQDPTRVWQQTSCATGMRLQLRMSEIALEGRPTACEIFDTTPAFSDLA
jgi:hypothetical protein